MRTNIVIDDNLLNEAFKVSHAKTKKDLIHEALRLLIHLRKRKDLTKLAGAIEFYEGFNHKKLRKMRHFSLNSHPQIAKISIDEKRVIFV